LTKHIFHPRHRFYCSFTPALFCLRKKARNKLGFTFARCFRFEICKLRRTPWKQDTTATASRGGGEGWRKNTHRHAAGGGGRRGEEEEEEGGGRVGAGVFFLKTSLAPRLAVVRLREEWKNNILPFRPEFSTLSLSLSLSVLYCPSLLSLFSPSLLSLFLFIIA